MAALAHILTALAAALSLSAPPTTASNRLPARRDATRLLQRVVLPAGARRLTEAPGGAGGLLAQPPSAPGTPQLVDRHGLWRVRASFGSVVAFEKAHAPHGSTLDGWSSASGPHYPSNQGLQFTFAAVAGKLSSRELEVETVALRSGWTAIRVDAQDVWVVTRPRSEVVPAGVHAIDIGSHQVTGGAKVARIIRWFDALPIAQPGVGLYCALIRSDSPTVRISFLDGNGDVLARASLLDAFHGVSSPCNPIRFSIHGHTQTPLVGGRFLLRVERLLRIRLR
jgi:hypothetical protein